MNITLHLTRNCNGGCSYCYAPPRPDAGMSLATARQTIQFALESGNGSCGMALFGGEPLLMRALMETMVVAARRQAAASGGRTHFKMTTNGLLLDEAFLDSPSATTC